MITPNIVCREIVLSNDGGTYFNVQKAGDRAGRRCPRFLDLIVLTRRFHSRSTLWIVCQYTTNDST